MGDFGDSSDIIDNGALFALVCHSYGQMVADEYFNRFSVHELSSESMYNEILI